MAWGVYHYVQEDAGSGSQKDEQSEAATDNKAADEGKKTGVEQGELAPDFTLPSLEGESKKLSDFRGQKVIINFWATWCGPCKAEMPEMQTYYKNHKSQDFTILGVNMTDTEKSKKDIKPFAKQYGVTFPVVLDTKGKVMSTYEVTGFPTSYFIDKQGVIQYKLVGAMNKDMVHKVIGKMD